MRTDLLASNLTAAKQQAVRGVLRAYRAGAVPVAQQQWRLFFERGTFDKHNDANKAAHAALIGNAARVQMCRWQVVGQLTGWIGNRANEFRDLVQRSALPQADRHALNLVNKAKAWFSSRPVTCKGAEVPERLRRLARSIMRHVMDRHRRPDLRRTSMWLDQRGAVLARPVAATQQGRVAWWVRVSTMVPRQHVAVPLLGHAHHAARQGRASAGVQVSTDRETGALKWGVVTDIGAACAAQRAAYAAEAGAPLALDFGLSTMFASEEGDHLGRGWLARLRRYDALMIAIARHVRRGGGKPRDSRRYRAAVTSLRGFIRSEVGRVLNRLIERRRPAALVLERLDFRNPALSRTMNRLLQSCGRGAIRAKLADLRQRFGATSEEVNPAYTSQTCSACGYVDRRNRRTQARFACLWCGHEMHADTNASRVIGQRRALPIGLVWWSKARVLREAVRAFQARIAASAETGWKGPAADPRLTNPYFAGQLDVVRSSECREAPVKLLENA